jgi:hypothetical protein
MVNWAMISRMSKRERLCHPILASYGQLVNNFKNEQTREIVPSDIDLLWKTEYSRVIFANQPTDAEHSVRIGGSRNGW